MGVSWWASRTRACAQMAHGPRYGLPIAFEVVLRRRAAASSAFRSSFRCRLIRASTAWPMNMFRLSPLSRARSKPASNSTIASSHSPARNSARPADHVVAGQRPAQAELGADSSAEPEGPRGVVQLVEVHQDVPAAQVQRVSMAARPGAFLGPVDGVVDLFQRVLQARLELQHAGTDGQGDAGAQLDRRRRGAFVGPPRQIVGAVRSPVQKLARLAHAVALTRSAARDAPASARSNSVTASPARPEAISAWARQIRAGTSTPVS